MNHDVVMTPQSHTYFDHYQSKPEEDEALAIGGYCPLAEVLWTAEKDKDYKDFLERLKKHSAIFESLGLNAHLRPE